jgi:hypothetical protein
MNLVDLSSEGLSETELTSATGLVRDIEYGPVCQPLEKAQQPKDAPARAGELCRQQTLARVP